MKKIIFVLFIFTALFFVGYFIGNDSAVPGIMPIALEGDIAASLDIVNDESTITDGSTIADGSTITDESTITDGSTITNGHTIDYEITDTADPTPILFEFIDAHADTITRAMETGQSLFRNSLHLDFERLMDFNAPVQIFAIWCSDRYLGSAFEYANMVIDFFERELAENSDIVELALSLEDLERNAANNKISAILALEGGEPLEGKIENVDHFYNRGVRLIGFTWNRENELGLGVGTGSDKGLKPFGIECVKRMNELGIIIDVSHLNEAGFWDVHHLSNKPYIASHSNVFSITPNRRNLKDDQIEAIVEKGGVIGMNLFPDYLSTTKSARITEIMPHIRYLISLGAEGNIVLGCDLDGVPTLPYEFTDVTSLKTMSKRIADEFDEYIASAIMSENFYDFFVRFWGTAD